MRGGGGSNGQNLLQIVSEHLDIYAKLFCLRLHRADKGWAYFSGDFKLL